jgi:hypothetical protein
MSKIKAKARRVKRAAKRTFSGKPKGSGGRRRY